MRICKVDECNKKHFALGYCQSHHYRFKKYGDPLVSKRSRFDGTTLDRFWNYVEKSPGCWFFAGALYSNGYGDLWSSESKKSVLAHRYSYELHFGDIPVDVQVDHICHTRSCVNPEHLRAATNKQNNENPSGLRIDNTTGYRGVRLEKRTGRYQGRVHHNGKEYSAGTYATAAQANDAVVALRMKLFTHNDLDRQAVNNVMKEQAA